MRNREGFTLVEVVVAVVLLAVVVLGLQGTTGKFTRLVQDSGQRTVGIRLAEDQVELVRADPVYAELEARYEGTETDVDGNEGLDRVTSIRQVVDSLDTGGVVSYKIITVTVEGQGLEAPIKRTVIVAAP